MSLELFCLNKSILRLKFKVGHMHLWPVFTGKMFISLCVTTKINSFSAFRLWQSLHEKRAVGRHGRHRADEWGKLQKKVSSFESHSLADLSRRQNKGKGKKYLKRGREERKNEIEGEGRERERQTDRERK